MFVVLDGIGGSEDMIVVLKLYDTVTGQYTTKAMMVQNPTSFRMPVPWSARRTKVSSLVQMTA